MKNIIGYEDYSIDINGNVFSNKFNKKCKLKILKSKGYCHIMLYKNGIGKIFKIHRLVAIAFIPNPENKQQINHKDGNKENNKMDNLEWVTPLENMQHASNNNLMKSGENNSISKLNSYIVSLIKTIYISKDRKFGSRALTKLLNLKSNNTIMCIIHKKTWKSINSININKEEAYNILKSIIGNNNE